MTDKITAKQWIAEWFANSFELSFNRKFEDLPDDVKTSWLEAADDFLADLRNTDLKD